MFLDRGNLFFLLGKLAGFKYVGERNSFAASEWKKLDSAARAKFEEEAKQINEMCVGEKSKVEIERLIRKHKNNLLNEV